MCNCYGLQVQDISYSVRISMTVTEVTRHSHALLTDLSVYYNVLYRLQILIQSGSYTIYLNDA
jgi:hypothetical protein